MNDKQITGFVNGITRARAKLERLIQEMDDHCGVSPDGVMWGHVANIQNVNAKLDDILSFMQISVKDALADQEAQ